GAAAGGPARRAALGPWLALALALLSPLALAYSATLFQEIPFTALAAFAVAAWLRRDGSAGRELLAGALITAAFFTRFNTGLLLGFALALDLLVDGAVAVRAGGLGAFLRRTLWLAAVPLVAFGWWFGLPWPGDAELGRAHREALLAFLGGNRGDSFRIPWSRRWVDWILGFCATPRMFALQAVGLLATLPLAARRGVRTLWLLLLGAGVPVWTHEFHLDRFLLHQGVAIWPLAGLGFARLLPGPRPGLLAAAVLAAALVYPSRDAHRVVWLLIDEPPKEAARDYVLSTVDRMGSLAPWRTYETAGLRADEADAFLDLIAAAVGPDERVAWLGINSELSPAAVHLGLLARGGSEERFRRDAARARADGQPDMCLSFLGVDPGWSDERLRAWAEAFDVVVTTRPVDFKGRGGRDYVRRYQDALLMTPGWGVETLGTVAVSRPAQEPVQVEVFACRRK
ncbi:MAG: hypothetical protein AAF682_31080, partial [Planctomycetota bacterium]